MADLVVRVPSGIAWENMGFLLLRTNGNGAIGRAHVLIPYLNFRLKSIWPRGSRAKIQVDLPYPPPSFRSVSSNAGLGSTGRRDCALGTEGDEVRRTADALGVDGSYLATSIVTKKEDIETSGTGGKGSEGRQRNTTMAICMIIWSFLLFLFLAGLQSSLSPSDLTSLFTETLTPPTGAGERQGKLQHVRQFPA